jgi:hypothetical protein
MADRVGALEGERTLTQMFPEYYGAFTTQWVDYKTWQGSPTLTNVIWNETYLDLSGYELDDLTLFPMGVSLQDPGLYSGSTAGGEALIPPMQVLDIISQDRLDPGNIFNNMALNNAPGMMETTEDWVQIIWGQYRTFLPQASYQGNATLYLPASGALFGSGNPTTVAKLWCYRFVILNGASTEGDVLKVPASRVILNAIVAEEDSKVFLMRQKRSYEIATGP